MDPDHRKRTVMLVDSHELRGAGLMKLLIDWASANDVDIISRRPDDVVDALSDATTFDMIIVSLGGSSVTDSRHASEIRIVRALAPDARLVVMSDVEETQEIQTALQLGAHGYLTSLMQPDLALDALSFILRGGSYFPHDIMREALRIIDEAPSGSETDNGTRKTTVPDTIPVPKREIDRNENRPNEIEDTQHLPELTRRQNEVLSLLSEGQPNKVIARSLGMTEATVKVHVRQIMRKFGVDNRTQAALCATAALRSTHSVISNGVTAMRQFGSVAH